MPVFTAFLVQSNLDIPESRRIFLNRLCPFNEDSRIVNVDIVYIENVADFRRQRLTHKFKRVNCGRVSSLA